MSIFTCSDSYDETGISSDVAIKYVYAGSAHSSTHLAWIQKQPISDVIATAPEFAYVLFHYMSRMLLKGTFEGY